MARPKSISDEDILAQAYELLMDQGVANLTFEKLGAQVGLVPAALVRRFKTKQQLLLEIDKYALEQTNIKVKQAMDETECPVDAILAQFTTILRFASTIDRFANGQEFLLMDFRDKNLYSNYQVSFKHRHGQVVELLKKADGLQGVNDYDELARHLEMIVHGAGHVWAMTGEDSIEEYITHHVQLALKPYKIQRSGNKSSRERQS